MYKAGKKSSKGTYECTRCGHTVELTKNADTLPICPNCHHDCYFKSK